jgi:hypothetical protein
MACPASSTSAYSASPLKRLARCTPFHTPPLSCIRPSRKPNEKSRGLMWLVRIDVPVA